MRVVEKLVPELRFPGFEGQIVTSLIRDLCTTIVDCVNKTAPTVDYETPYRMIRTNNVRDGKLDLSNVRYVTKEIFNIWNRRGAPQKGDLIFTREAPVGEMGILYEKEGIFLGQRTMMYRANVNVCSNLFLLNSLQTRYCQRQIDGFSNGGTVAHMRVPDCGKIKVLHPVLSEQKKIASFLSAVDKKIEKLTRKKELLETYKKGVMQKIFSREIRFKDENEKDFPDWEKKRLGDVAIINPKGKPLPNHFVYIDLESVEKGMLKEEKYIQKTHAPSRAQRVLEKNDLLFQMVRPYQKNNLYFGLNGDYVASTGYAQIRAKGDSAFLYQYLHFEKFVNLVIRNSTGSNYPAINSTDLKKILVKNPLLQEQRRIGVFLTKVDKKIKAVQTHLTQTQEFKKGLLQKMFV